MACPIRYELDGVRFEAATPAFEKALAQAHAARLRPLCLCREAGVAMYVARLDDGYIVKRMPDTGSLHAAACPSYEPPPDFSGLGQVLGSAIKEDPRSGHTTLRLDFPLSKSNGRAGGPVPGGESESVSSDGTRLSLRGLLHYLWDQAELTRWQPGFSGKRSWATVRKLLMQAAQDKVLRNATLSERLYVPEFFSVEHLQELSARRMARWARATAQPGKQQPLLLLIGEVKEIVQARYAYKAIIKHLPDQGFAVDEALYRRMGRRFEVELALWAASEHLRMVMIATFSVNHACTPTLIELSLMPVSQQWLPIEDAFELQLIDHLIREQRSFVKGLRYNLGRRDTLATAVLTDVPDSPVPLFISSKDEPPTIAEELHRRAGPEAPGTPEPWIWHVASAGVPSLPEPTDKRRSSHPVTSSTARS